MNAAGVGDRTKEVTHVASRRERYYLRFAFGLRDGVERQIEHVRRAKIRDEEDRRPELMNQPQGLMRVTRDEQAKAVLTSHRRVDVLARAGGVGDQHIRQLQVRGTAREVGWRVRGPYGGRPLLLLLRTTHGVLTRRFRLIEGP